jgi:hypothetical protein
MAGRQRSKERAQRTSYVLDLTGIGILAAPLAIGSVHLESRLLLAALTSLLLATVWLNPRRALPRLPAMGSLGSLGPCSCWPLGRPPS